ncbi:glycosyltransferase family 4 protein [Flagellimonas marinaquae]
MKIIINSAHQRFGGCIQVVLSFINECKKFPQNEYYIWVGEGLVKLIDPADFPDNFYFEYFNFGPITIWKTFKINRVLKLAEQRIKPDVIIATSGPSYFKSDAPQILGYNLPLYIYEDSPFVKQLSFYREARRRIKKYLHFYFFKRDLTALVVQTDDVNQRVRKVLNVNKVYTVTNTPSSFYFNIKKYSTRLPEKDTDEFRFITISSYYGHKNLEIIPKVLSILGSKGINNIKFVLTLKKEDFENKIGAHPSIVNVGPIKPFECPSLYAECDALFLPTLAECFSASYPEAMIMEKPIITTDLGFAHNICADAAIFYKPMDAVSAADAIEKLINDNTLQNTLIKNGKKQLKSFDSPEERASKYLEVCETISKNVKNNG